MIYTKASLYELDYTVPTLTILQNFTTTKTLNSAHKLAR